MFKYMPCTAADPSRASASTTTCFSRPGRVRGSVRVLSEKQRTAAVIAYRHRIHRGVAARRDRHRNRALRAALTTALSL